MRCLTFFVPLLLVASCGDFARIERRPSDDPDARDANDARDASPDADLSAAPNAPSVRGPIANTYTGARIAAGTKTRFSWSSGGGDPRALTYMLEVSSAADFASGLSSFQTTAQFLDLDLASYDRTTVPVGQKLFWRVKACFEGKCSPNARTRVLHYGRSEHDLNGDGYADLAIGEAFGSTGAVYVYFGGPGAFNTTADGVLSLGESGDSFGTAADIAGDVNGDGFADLIIGADIANKAAVYFGGPGTSFNTTSDWTATGTASTSFGYAVAGAGDVNGDGYADVLVGAFNGRRVYLYLGGQQFNSVADSMLQSSEQRFGISVAGRGDFNGDGLGAVAVGIIPDGAPGSVRLFYGNTSASVLDSGPTLSKGASVDDFGRSIAFAGDLNADGFSDLAIGAAVANSAHIYLGQSARPVENARPTYTAQDVGTGSSFGSSVSDAGDMNGDGFDDLLIAASTASANGTASGIAFIYFGGTTFNSNADGQLFGQAGYRAGAFSGAVGDTNGDGFDDVVLCNEPGINTLGRAFLFKGGSTIVNSPAVTFSGTVNGAGFGSSVASMGSAPPSRRGLSQCRADST